MIRASMPVSSRTSRSAVCSIDSPGSALPLGNDQSSYLGRCTIRILIGVAGCAGASAAELLAGALDRTRPPAATISSVSWTIRLSVWSLISAVKLARTVDNCLSLRSPDIGCNQKWDLEGFLTLISLTARQKRRNAEIEHNAASVRLD